MSNDFNGYSFDDAKTRRRMRYLVVMDGDLDLNNAYGFTSKRALDKYLREDSARETLAVFAVTDVTPNAGNQRGA